MAKLTLLDVANLQNESSVVTKLTQNNDATEVAMENTLSRDGTSPNQMLSNLDMNNYKIINLPDALTDQEPATYSQLVDGLTAVGGGAVVNGTYVTLSTNPLLFNERVLTGTGNVSVTDNGANNTVVVDVADNELKALATTTAAADTVPYYTGATTASTTSLTSYARTLIDDVDAATARSTLGSVIGTNVQAWDTDLDAIASQAGTGLLSRTGAGTAATRTLTAPAAGFTITNPAGVAGDPTFVLANDLAGLEGMSGTGLAAHTAANTWVERTITQPAAGITVTNGGGVAGNPTLALANDLAAYEALASNGLVARTGTDAATTRTITQPAAGITVTNGDGVAGNPTLALTNDLGAVEGLATTGIVRRTGTDTWTASNAVTNAELQNNSITIGTVATALGGTLSAATGRSSTALNVESATGVGNTNYTILATDRYVFTNAAFTVTRTWTLPAANAVNAGQRILIGDLQGTVTSTNLLTIQRAGADTINGTTSISLSAASTALELVSDGTSKWYAVQSSGSGGGGASSFVAYEYTATAAQTTFSGADINARTLLYTVNFLLVYVNGDLLNAADYTASNGTSVVFATGRALNDQVKIVAMNQSSVGLIPGNNLSDVSNVATSRANLSVAPFEALAYNNIILNGGMSVSQELGFGSPSTLANGVGKYICDQWHASYSHAAATAVFTGTAQSSGGPAYSGTYLELKATTLSAMAGASDYAILQQPIEGYRTERLCYSIAPQSAVLGFYVWATIAGTATVAVRNSANNRTYLANFTVITPATWEYKTITIPGDASGTWVTNNGVGIYLSFCFGGGTTWNGTNATWNAGNFLKTTSTTNFFATNANKTLISNVSLMPGTEAATEVRAPLLQRPYPEELRQCQRYFWRSTGVYPSILGNTFTNTAIYSANVPLPTTMRAIPTATVVGTWSVSGCGQPTIGQVSSEGFTLQVSGTAATNVAANCDGSTTYVKADARL